MTILALSQSTVRLLGSSVAISTPVDLIKELLDNSIDAGASNVEISVAPNIIDKIQVRDNGRGISWEDLAQIGRRAHTSKLQSFEELRYKGGQSLGFRGEALASAVALAIVTVITRTSSDPVGSRIILSPNHKSLDGRRTPVSAPIGTTVQATKLFEAIPVRKQHSLKEKDKHMNKIKEVLISYALARLHLRLSFKVIGEPRYTWSYAPKTSSTIRDAAMQLFGRDLVANCVHIGGDSHNQGCQPSTPDQTKVTLHFEGLIPRSGCDATHVKAKGCFISVDSRPMSTSRGFAKKLVASIRKQLSGCSKQGGPLANPFMHLNIKCPSDSYDPNIAPLKDEVLFHNEAQILNAFTTICDQIHKVERVSSEPAEGSDDDEGLPSCLLTAGTNDEDQAVKHDRRSTGDQNALEDTKMRVLCAVNLARTDSNGTDDCVLGGMIDIKIPPTQAQPQEVMVQRRETTFKLSANAFNSAFIEDYFAPRANSDFEILADDSAAPGAHNSDNCQISTDTHQPFPRRQPLQPLSKTELNRRQNCVDDDPNWAQLALSTPPRFDAAVIHQPIQATMNAIDEAASSYRGLTREADSGTLSSGSGSLEQTMIGIGSASGGVELPSPPASDPFHLDRVRNPAFRPPWTHSSPPIGSSPPRYIGQQSHHESPLQHRTSLPTMSNDRGLGIGPEVSASRERGQIRQQQQQQQQQQPVHRLNLPSPVDGLGAPRPNHVSYHEGETLRHDNHGATSSHGLFSPESPSSWSSGIVESECQQTAYSHTRQLMLMRTPRPETIVDPKGAFQLNEYPLREEESAFTSPNAKDSSMKGASPLSDQQDISLIRPATRQRSRRSSLLKRRPSSMLPLESIPFGCGNYNQHIVYKVNLQTVQRVMEQQAMAEETSSTLGFHGSLLFDSLSEKQDTESGIHKVVDLWSKANEMSVEMNFAFDMASNVKM